MVGDIVVDEHGTLPGQALPSDDDENEPGQEEGEADAVDNRNNKRSSVQEIAAVDGESPGTAAGGGRGHDIVASNTGGGGGSNDSGAPEVEPEDLAMGFEYEGEVRNIVDSASR